MSVWSPDTLTVQVPFLLVSTFEVAVMVTVPTLSVAVTLPVASTVAMVVSLLVHVTPVSVPGCASTVAVRV